MTATTMTATTLYEALALLPEPATDDGHYDLRLWRYLGRGDLVLNKLSNASVHNGLTRPMLHMPNCPHLVDVDITGWPLVTQRAAFALWAHERAAQPERTVWFCQDCLMGES